MEEESNSQGVIQELLERMVDPKMYLKWKEGERRKWEEGKSKSESNAEIESLDIEDYLNLMAHQKKILTTARWRRLKAINESRKLQQESYKHFFSITSYANYRRLEHPGYYQQLLNQKDKFPDNFFTSIEKDIPRTLSLTHPLLEDLRGVLSAYAMRNPSLLYCQGMNYLVAFLLMNSMSQEHTFWMVSCLIENILPSDYYKDLTTVSITTCIFNDILPYLLPEFEQQMREIGMDPSIFLVPWFVCLFTKGFINPVSSYLINHVLLETRRYRVGFVLLRIALAIIAVVLHREEPFSYNQDFRSFKENLETKVFEISLREMEGGLQMIEINHEVYCEIEDMYRRDKQENRSILLHNKIAGKKMTLPPCEETHPICFHRIEMQKKLGCIEKAFVIKNGIDIKAQMVSNYLDSEPVQQEPVEISFKSIEQCLLGRHKHICMYNSEQYQQDFWVKKSTFQRQTLHKLQIIDDEEGQAEVDNALQVSMQVSKIEDKFAQLSQYFVIDQNYGKNQEQEDDEDEQNRKFDEQLQKEFMEFSIQKPSQHQSEGVRSNSNDMRQSGQSDSVAESMPARVGKVFRRVFSKILDMRKIRSTTHLKSDKNLKNSN